MISARSFDRTRAFVDACERYVQVHLDPGMHHSFISMTMSRFKELLHSYGRSPVALSVFILPPIEWKNSVEWTRGWKDLGDMATLDGSRLPDGLSFMTVGPKLDSMVRFSSLMATAVWNSEVLVVYGTSCAPGASATDGILEAAASSVALVAHAFDGNDPPSRSLNAPSGMRASRFKVPEGPMFLPDSAVQDVSAHLHQFTEEQRISIAVGSYVRRSGAILQAIDRDLELRKNRLTAELTVVARKLGNEVTVQEGRRLSELASLRLKTAELTNLSSTALAALDREALQWKSFRATGSGADSDGARLLAEFAMQHDSGLRERIRVLVQHSVFNQMGATLQAKAPEWSPAGQATKSMREQIYLSLATAFEKKTIELEIASGELWAVVREHLGLFSCTLADSAGKMRRKLLKELEENGIESSVLANCETPSGLNSDIRRLNDAIGARTLLALKAQVRKELVLPSVWEGFRWARSIYGQFGFVVSILLVILAKNMGSSGTVVRMGAMIVLPALLALILYGAHARREQQATLREFVETNLVRIFDSLKKVRADCITEYADMVVAYISALHDSLERKVHNDLTETENRVRVLTQTAAGSKTTPAPDESIRQFRAARHAAGDLKRLLDSAALESESIIRALQWP